MAKHQATNLRSQFKSLDRVQQEFIEKLSIVISVNGVELTQNQIDSLESTCDDLVCSSIEIGADLNIAQGFLKAIQYPCDFFWILSTNDVIEPRALNEIVDAFLANPDCDLIGADENNVSRKIEVSNVLIKPINGIHFGLISAVIYRTKNVVGNFPVAMKLNWTGWGQLGVIQTSCFTNNGLSVVTIPKDKLFMEMAVDRLNSEAQLKKNSAYYSHSFFGMPLLIASLFASDKKAKQKYLQSWLFSNWYKISFFSSNPTDTNEFNGINRSYWRQSLAEDIVKTNGPASRAIYIIGKTIDWQYFRKFRFAHKIKKLF
jgi:hypothetical protein